MNLIPIRRFGAALALVLALAGPCRATEAGATTWTTEAFHAVVSGTSTLHAWTVESRTARGELTCTTATVTGSLQVLAKSLSGGPAGLNDRMYAALKAEKFPVIAFEASDVPRIPSTLDAAAPAVWPVRGKLTIAGVSRELALECRITAPTDGRFLLETETELKMTDFGLKPPTFMGLVRTGDAVTVKIRWELRPVPAAATD